MLYVLWPDPLIVPARGALVSELLVLAGAVSVTAEGGDGYPRYSLEAAVAGAPEVIILASHSHGQGPMVAGEVGALRGAARGRSPGASTRCPATSSIATARAWSTASSSSPASSIPSVP